MVRTGGAGGDRSVREGVTIMGATVAQDPGLRVVQPEPSELTEACRRRLHPADIQFLDGVLAQKYEFIDDPRLDEADIEAELFADDPDATARDVRTPGQPATVPSRFVKMTIEQEQATFLRYNYARREVVWLLAGRKPSRPISLVTGRAIVKWHRRVLAIRSDIVNSNFPLVLAMAKHSRFNALDISEMISEGNMALLRSINKYNLSKGFRFSSYACRSILKAFSRVALRTSRYRSRFPTEYDESIDRSDHHETRRRERREYFLEELQTVLNKNAAHLSEVERLVIAERFALESGKIGEVEAKTLGEVGEMVGLTKERVRQIQNRALEKLRIAMANRFAAA